jgi:hypothetical protein
MDDTIQSTMQLNESLSKTRHEIDLLTRSIDVKRIEFTEEVTKQIKELDEKIKSLGKETVLLHSIPQKLSTRLSEIIPIIAQNLHELNQHQAKELNQVLNKNIEDHNNSIKDSAFRLKQIKDEIVQIDGQRIKRYFLGLGITILISVLASLGASYMMIQFPGHVQISDPSNVKAPNKEVSLWSSKNVNISGDTKQMNRKC